MNLYERLIDKESFEAIKSMSLNHYLELKDAMILNKYWTEMTYSQLKALSIFMLEESEINEQKISALFA